MDIKEKLINKVKIELREMYSKFDNEEIKSFLEWMKVEYINYMLLTREACIETLNKLKRIHEKYSPLIFVLEKNINEYASLQCFYIVSFEELKTLK